MLLVVNCLTIAMNTVEQLDLPYICDKVST